MTKLDFNKNVDDEFYGLALRQTQSINNEKVEDTQTLAERFYVLLHYQIAAQMPRGHTNMHPYSTGRTYANMTTECNGGTWAIKISPGVDYARYMLGYDEAGNHYNGYSTRTSHNFAIVPNAIDSISRIISSQYGGIVKYGN